MKIVLLVSLSLLAGIVSQSNAERTFVNPLGGDTLRVIKECQDTDGEYSLIESNAPANSQGPPPHHHHLFAERIQVIEGTLYATIDGKDHQVPAGEKVVFEADSVHRWWTQDEPVTFRVETHPCFNGFHQGVEILANLEPEKRAKDGRPKSMWYLAVGQEITGTILDVPYVGWIFNIVFGWMSKTEKGLRVKEELLAYLPAEVQKGNDSMPNNSGEL